MRYAVIGTGGREHALAWKLAAEPGTDHVYVLPGNPGISRHAPDNISCVDVSPDQVVDNCAALDIDLVVVGPEVPLCDGIADALRQAGISCFGPSQAAAQLEASKEFAKRVMRDAGVATAAHQTFTDIDSAQRYAREQWPVVIKADGLAAGKGVAVPTTLKEAQQTIEDYLSGRFGEASERILIEKRLEGPEVSIIAISDGSRALFLPTSRDHKRLRDHDVGPNTGGMGAVSPAPYVSTSDLARMKAAMRSVISTMHRNGTPFVGFLYGGFMLTAEGPYVLEFNVRLGDPETQALMMALSGIEIGPLLRAAATSSIEPGQLDGRPAACIVLASGGYPAAVRRGDTISLPTERVDGELFYAGVGVADDVLVTNGGRVLSACAHGDTLEQALASAYHLADRIEFDGKQYRSDIGRTVSPSQKASR